LSIKGTFNVLTVDSSG